MDTIRNFTLLCDYYELTMSNGYFRVGEAEKNVYFDVFYRTIPDGGGFSVFAGLEQIIHYIENLHFSEEDIAYLRNKGQFDEKFLEYLRTFRFTGDIYSVEEGTPIFPYEPIMTIRAPAAEAQILETFVLLSVNHQSLVATKANRIVRAAQGRGVAEFGSRRAHGADGAILGARAAYIGGVGSTACTISDVKFGIPATGTMAHSWVQMFDNEYDAFRCYCELYPHNVTLLIDTYDVLNSGLPNAIRVFKEILIPQGIRNFAVRLDSGDLAYLTKKIRRILQEEGLSECRIVATNSLDENIIRDLIAQGAEIDAFGVGERLITAKSDAVFDGVYKLCAVEGKNGEVVPRIKISENVAKITNPSYKKLYRIFDKKTGKAIADYITLYDEVVDESQPLTLFDPQATWKKKVVSDYIAEPLHKPIFLNGKCVYTSPSIHDIREHCRNSVGRLWDEVKRFENPHRYYVDLSQKLWDLKHKMLHERRKEK